MFLVMYDIENDKTRTHFAKILTKYGTRLQYSVFQIKNSQRLLDNLKIEITKRFSHRFKQCDSVYIFHIPDEACVAKFGYPTNEDSDLVIK